MQYNPEPPTPYATVPRGQPPGLFSPAAGIYNASASNPMHFSADPTPPHASLVRGHQPGFFAHEARGLGTSTSSTHRSHSSFDSAPRSAGTRSHAFGDGVIPARSYGHDDAVLTAAALKPVNYSRVETTFLIEEAKAKLLSLYQQEESLSLHLEAKRHSLLHLKSEILRTDQVIREFERKRVFDLQQDASDRSLPQKDMEEVEKLSRDILQEERVVSRLHDLLEETKNRKAAFQGSLDRDRADREEIKAAIAKFSKKSPAAP